MDGKITDSEKAEADRLIKEVGADIEGNSTYERYKEVLGKK